MTKSNRRQTDSTDHNMSTLAEELITEETSADMRRRNFNSLMECLNTALINLDSAALHILKGGYAVEDSFRLAHAAVQDLYNKIEEAP